MRNTLPQSCPLARSLLGLILIFSVAIIVPWASSARVRRESRTPQPNLPLLPVAQVVRQTNLVSDLPGVALIDDPFLVNPRGVARTASGPFWVVNNGTDTVTFYQGDVSGSPLVRNAGLSLVGIPAPSPSASPGAEPAGIVVNNTSDFPVSPAQPPAAPASFIVSTELGALNAWQPLLGPVAQVVSVSSGRAYTGITTGSNASGNLLFAADFQNGKIDVFDSGFNPTSVPGNFVDPTIPANSRPFNIQNLGGALYVTYRQVGSGGGFVRKFDTNGVRDSAFDIDNGPVNVPWGMAIAPPGAGPLSNKLLVGNNAVSFLTETSSINAFDPATGAHLDSLVDEGGNVLRIANLWALVFGNGTNGGDANTLYFSAGLFFSEEHGLFGSLRLMDAPATSLIKFSSENFFTSENSGHIDITVTRTGDLSGTATVNYATADDFGNAQKSEYEIALGKLTFNPGETTKSFRVLIVDNNLFAGGTTHTHPVVLSNPEGAGLTSPSIARFGIQDDEGDTPGQPPNIIDDARSFVRQHYFDFLNREPGAGLDFWTNEITSCGTDQQCIEIKRINVSAAFFLSIEFQRTGVLAYLTRKASFDSLPRYGAFMRDVQALQKNFVFGAPGADAQLEANKQLYFNEFITGPEFVARYAGLTNAQYVDALILNTGVVFSAAERDALVNGLGNGSETRATVLRKIAEKESFRQKEFNSAFVLMEYFGYLRRFPGSPPDFNLDGFNFWLDKLNAFNGDFVRSEMVKAFITSIEYRSRFGPP